jgi:hypothetical protein
MALKSRLFGGRQSVDTVAEPDAPLQIGIDWSEERRPVTRTEEF